MPVNVVDNNLPFRKYSVCHGMKYTVDLCVVKQTSSILYNQFASLSESYSSSFLRVLRFGLHAQLHIFSLQKSMKASSLCFGLCLLMLSPVCGRGESFKSCCHLSNESFCFESLKHRTRVMPLVAKCIVQMYFDTLHLMVTF